MEQYPGAALMGVWKAVARVCHWAKQFQSLLHSSLIYFFVKMAISHVSLRTGCILIMGLAALYVIQIRSQIP